MVQERKGRQDGIPQRVSLVRRDRMRAKRTQSACNSNGVCTLLAPSPTGMTNKSYDFLLHLFSQ